MEDKKETDTRNKTDSKGNKKGSAGITSDMAGRAESSQFRKFVIPRDLLQSSAGLQAVIKLFSEALKKAQNEAENDPEKKDSEDNVKALFKHSISTANFCLQYYAEYLEGQDSAIKPEALYVAAIYFNYYKFTTDGLENTDLSGDALKELQDKKMSVNREIKNKSGQKEAMRYLFVQDKTGQSAHEIIFAANAIDNLMCIKNADGEYLSLITVFSIISASDSFNPDVIKKFEKMFIKQVQDGSSEFRITFSSMEEKQAFGRLDGELKASLFTVISMIMDKNDEQVSVEDLKTYDPQSRQLIVFTSDPDHPQEFFDRRTNTLYSM